MNPFSNPTTGRTAAARLGLMLALMAALLTQPLAAARAESPVEPRAQADAGAVQPSDDRVTAPTDSGVAAPIDSKRPARESTSQKAPPKRDLDHRSKRGGSQRTLDAITIEGEIDVPQVLFITARDQFRTNDFLHRLYLKDCAHLGMEAPSLGWPTWLQQGEKTSWTHSHP